MLVVSRAILIQILGARAVLNLSRNAPERRSTLFEHQNAVTALLADTAVLFVCAPIQAKINKR